MKLRHRHKKQHFASHEQRVGLRVYSKFVPASRATPIPPAFQRQTRAARTVPGLVVWPRKYLPPSGDITCAMSAKASSMLMISMSRTGSTDPSTWIMSASSKHLTTDFFRGGKS